VAYLNRELGLNLFGNDANDNDSGLADLPFVNQDVQPPNLTEEEALELAIAHKLDKLHDLLSSCRSSCWRRASR
jgi:hypothetical protein